MWTNDARSSGCISIQEQVAQGFVGASCTGIGGGSIGRGRKGVGRQGGPRRVGDAVTSLRGRGSPPRLAVGIMSSVPGLQLPSVKVRLTIVKQGLFLSKRLHFLLDGLKGGTIVQHLPLPRKGNACLGHAVL